MCSLMCQRVMVHDMGITILASSTATGSFQLIKFIHDCRFSDLANKEQGQCHIWIDSFVFILILLISLDFEISYN